MRWHFSKKTARRRRKRRRRKGRSEETKQQQGSYRSCLLRRATSDTLAPDFCIIWRSQAAQRCSQDVPLPLTFINLYEQVADQKSQSQSHAPVHPTSSRHIQIWFLCIRGNHNKRGWVGDSSGGRQAESDLFPQGAVWGGVDEVLPQPACILPALSSVTGEDCHNVLHYALQRHR